MNKLSILLRGSGLQGLESLVAIVVGFVTLPLMLNHLGQDLYGVWVLVGGFTTMLYIFDLGFASSVTRTVAASIAQKDYAKTNGVVNSALVIYSGLAGVILLVVAAISIFYEPSSEQVISRTELQWVLIIVGLSIAIEFPFKAFAGLTTAYLRYDLVATYKIITKLLNTAVLIYLLFNDYGLVAIALLQLVTGVISNIFFFYIAKSVYKEMQVAPSFISKAIMLELFHFSSWAFVIDMTRMLKERIDVFFIGAYVSLSAVAIYYVPIRLVEYSIQLLYKALNVALPILTGNASLKDTEKFRSNLLFFNRINSYFSALTFVFFLLFGKTIIYYWMGTEFDYSAAYLILLILLAGRLSALASNGFNTALYATAKHNILAYVNFCEAIATGLLLWYFLAASGEGAKMAAVAIALPLALGRLIFLPYWAINVLHITAPISLLLLSYRPLSLLVVAFLIYAFYPLQVELSAQHFLRAMAVGAALLLFMKFDLMPRERIYLQKLGEKFYKKRNF